MLHANKNLNFKDISKTTIQIIETIIVEIIFVTNCHHDETTIDESNFEKKNVIFRQNMFDFTDSDRLMS